MAVGLVVFYGMVDPGSRLFPPCMFRAATGLSCPGCGTQRALHAALTGHPLEAWGYNPLLPFGLALLAVLAAAHFFPHSWAGKVAHWKFLGWTALAIIAVYVVVRNIFGF